jgi:aryl carrier-like protein
MLAVLTTTSAFAATAPANPVGDDGNPFDQGTIAISLTPQAQSDLLQFVNQSRVTLQQALTTGTGQDRQTQSETYLAAVKSVVVSSYGVQPRAELLLRVILNQALQLTGGIPSADGSYIQVPGVLAQAEYQNLLPIILSDSIQLALKYSANDQDAVTKNQLVDLPIAEVALERLQLAQRWERSVLELDLAAAFEKTVLQQWLNLMVSQDALHQAAFAVSITQVSQAVKSPASSDPGIEERSLRLLIQQTAAQVSQQLATQGSGVPMAGVTATALTPTQVAELTAQPNTLVDAQGQACIDVPSGNGAIGTALQQYSCGAGNGNQAWNVQSHGSTFSLAWGNGQTCLSVQDGAMSPLTPIVEAACDPTKLSQLFTLATLPDGSFIAQVVSSGLCLAVNNAQIGNGAQIVQQECTGAQNQAFQIAAWQSGN